MPVQNEKIIVFDEDGNPKELRYYEAEKLVARLGTILDGDSNFIGLRELDIEEVSPQSWFDKLRHKPQPKRIDVLTVDFIGLINWINTIKTIKTIENIENIENIEDIENIDRIHIAPNNLIHNGEFAIGNLEGWESEFAAVSTTQKHSGSYSCDIQSNVASGSAGSIWQYLPNVLSDVLTLSLWHFSDVTDTVVVNVYYTDGTSSQTTDNGTGVWAFKVITLTAGKRLKYVHILHLIDTKHCYVADITLAESIDWRVISQSTRTNLLNKPEREDLLLKDVDFAASVNLQSFLAAVADQKHKVYAYGYEADADGVYYFSATVNGSAFKFGRRITKGVYAQTFVHPVVCDVNTILNFMSTTGNSKAWIQYMTEA